MTESPVFNIRDICRGCLSDKRDNLRSIFDTNILETFILCTNIQVTEKDGLPKLICSSCVYKVISWVTFKTQCEQSDEILRTTFQCSDNKGTIASNNEKSTVEFTQDFVDCESVDISFQSNSEPVKEEVETLLQHSSERYCDITENIDNWNTTEAVVEAVVNTGYSRKLIIGSSQHGSDLHHEKENEHSEEEEEYVEDVDGTFDDIDQSDEDHSSNPNNIELSKTVDLEKTSTPAKQKQKCDDCGKSFRNLDRLKSHQRGEHEGKKPEVCPLCQKEFNNLRALRRHRLKHSDVKQFRCNECGKMYKYQTSLTLHKKGHANVRRFVCDLCGKSFVRAHGLQSHLLSHSTLTPFSCDHDSCGKQFKNAIMLRNHQRRHLGIKKYVCSYAECRKEFITSAELNTHVRSHTGSKPFSCSMCDKSYKTKSHLSVHHRSHSGARPYACDFCSLTFAHNKVLKHHRLVHLGQLPWICDVCKRPFRQRSTLMKHKKLHTYDGKGEIRQEQPIENSDYAQNIHLTIELDTLEK